MKRVAVVTDSSANLPEELVNELNIHVVPILLTHEGQIFRDGIDITPNQIYRWLRENKRVPSTSSPSIGDFLRLYIRLKDEAVGIVSIHPPPRLSAIYNAARTASQLVDGVLIRVMYFDTAAMGQGFVVLEAARAAAAGADLETVVARAKEVASKVHLLATLETLEYLQWGGRIGGAAALLGSVLRIQPVLCVAGGRVEVFTRARSRQQAVRLMLRQIAEEAGSRPVHVAILHSDAAEEAEQLRQQIVTRFKCVELYITELTPVMGTHAGPGVLGVAFYVA